jgi:uncharacterized phage protein (TIGR02216 family)
MLALATRFEKGRISARDCVRIIGAGLRGAGHEIANDAVARMASEGGAAGYVEIVARLLNATFAGQSSASGKAEGRVTAALSLGRRDGAGLGVLGLAPDVFWAMTPREFDAALRGRLGAGFNLRHRRARIFWR